MGQPILDFGNISILWRVHHALRFEKHLGDDLLLGFRGAQFVGQGIPGGNQSSLGTKVSWEPSSHGLVNMHSHFTVGQ